LWNPRERITVFAPSDRKPDDASTSEDPRRACESLLVDHDGARVKHAVIAGAVEQVRRKPEMPLKCSFADSGICTDRSFGVGPKQNTVRQNARSPCRAA